MQSDELSFLEFMRVPGALARLAASGWAYIVVVPDGRRARVPATLVADFHRLGFVRRLRSGAFRITSEGRFAFLSGSVSATA